MNSIDGTSPRLGEDHKPAFIDWYKQGRVTAFAPTMSEGPMTAAATLGRYDRMRDVVTGEEDEVDRQVPVSGLLRRFPVALLGNAGTRPGK